LFFFCEKRRGNRLERRRKAGERKGRTVHPISLLRNSVGRGRRKVFRVKRMGEKGRKGPILYSAAT